MTNDKKTLEGVYTALVTPFSKSGRLVLTAIPKLLAFQAEAGIDGVVVGGTNGEGISLSVRERKALLEQVLAHANGLDVIASVGACALSDACELARHAHRAGASAVLVLPPFFFKDVTPRGLAACYQAVASAAQLPVILYSIPQFSGIPITSAVIRALSGTPFIFGVKESSPEKYRAVRILRRHPHLKLYVGNDLYLAQLMQEGAAGVISGLANAFPELVVEVVRCVREGRDPRLAQKRLNQAINAVMNLPMVGGVKAALKVRGVADLHVRPPLTMPNSLQKRSMVEKLKAAKLI